MSSLYIFQISLHDDIFLTFLSSLCSPGGPYHIQKWAQGWEGNPGWYLIFPFYGNATRKIPQHPMNRWVTRAKEPDIVKVARLGDTIAYRDLPSELKTDAVAE